MYSSFKKIKLASINLNINDAQIEHQSNYDKLHKQLETNPYLFKSGNAHCIKLMTIAP